MARTDTEIRAAIAGLAEARDNAIDSEDIQTAAVIGVVIEAFRWALGERSTFDGWTFNDEPPRMVVPS